ncbi:hypothetical protein WJX81_004719 [Elliptochloris bilobata]|uniref:acid phosphatase n=1 Tax=Elliptochloris bilobata TaxID=381761 RepID=A0AAW1QYA7_9CHLO
MDEARLFSSARASSSNASAWALGPCSACRIRVGNAGWAAVLAAAALLATAGVWAGTRARDAPVLATFLVVGDWGRLGQYNQSGVAALMGRKAALEQPDFVISTGDNFYESGLMSPSDEAFQVSFANLYSAPGLQVPWYAVLGNHDYGDNCDHAESEPPGCSTAGREFYSPLHQLDTALVAADARWHLQRSYQLVMAGGRVDLFFIDTSPFVQKYYDTEWADRIGGLTEQSWREGLAELSTLLARSRADWKIVIGHHPPRSNGHHNNTQELLDLLEPVMEEHGVRAYLSGHDHNLEHIHLPGASVNYVISGGGSKSDRGFIGAAHSQFQWPASGFVAARLTGDELVLEYLCYTAGAAGDDLEPCYVVRIPRLP